MAAADSGSFTRAAELLHYSPSGVSQLVTALEGELGLTLLHRTRRGVSVTEDGKRFLPVIRELLAKEEQIYQLAEASRGLLVGSVNVASYMSIAMRWLPGLIRAFREKYPRVQIQLMEGIGSEIEGWLKEHVADVGFTNRPESPEFDWFPLAQAQLLAVLPKNHPLAAGASYPISGCAGEKLIMIASGHCLDPDVSRLLSKHGIVPDISYITSLDSTALAMAEQGLGITLTNEWIAKSYDYDVVCLPLDPPEYLDFGMAVVSADTVSPAVKRWITFAQEYLREWLRQSVC